jgi:hypothetical protein
MILVMSADKLLVPPEAEDKSSEQSGFWSATWLHVDEYIPGLRLELFPEKKDTDFGK